MRLPLRVVLVVPFFIQIVAAVGLVGYLSHRNGQATIHDLASQLEERASLQVSEHLNAYLGASQSVIRLMADAAELKLIDISNHKETLHYLWRLAHAFPDASYLNYGQENGDFIGLGRAYNVDNKLFIEETSLATMDHLFQYEVVGEGEKGRLYKDKPFEDFRKDVWYAQPKVADKAIWTDIYNWVDEPEVMVIGAGKPIYLEGKLVGIAGVDLLLASIWDYLRSLNLSPNAKIFIIERSGNLVATSDQQLPFDLVDGEAIRRKVEDSQDPLIRNAGLFLKNEFASFDKIKEPQVLTFKLEGKLQFLRITPWRDSHGLNWLIGVAVPESDFTTQIEKNNQITFILCSISLLIATITGIYTSRWIAAPIIKLVSASEAIAKGEITQSIDHSSIKELEILSNAFNLMSAQLHESFNSLEMKVEERTRQLKKTENQLWQQDKMSSLGRLVAGIAHEINNPVTFIDGNLQHLESYMQELIEVVELYEKNHPESAMEIKDHLEEIDLPFLTQDLQNVLQSMRVGTARIAHIVKSLKNFSRLDEMGLKKTNLSEDIGNTLFLLEHRLNARSGNKAIAVVQEREQLPLVECYPNEINQVFMNLLNNAIDAIEIRHKTEPDYQGLIHIKTQRIDAEKIEICIQDNGCGIKPSIQEKIFDPFFTTKPVGQGMGMGLAISYQIITEHHHGDLFYRSPSPDLTEFVIQLPIEQTAQTIE